MSEFAVNVDRLLYLAERVCDENASDNDYVELDTILRADAESRRRYLDYCRMHVTLTIELQSHAALQAVGGQAEVFARNVALGRGEELGSVAQGSEISCHREKENQNSEISTPQPLVPSPELLIPPIVLDLSSTPPPSPGFFMPGSWLFSYGVATLLTGAAFLGAWTYKVSCDYPAAKPSPSAVETFAGPQKQLDVELDVVGRITAAADCRWAGSVVAPAATIRLGGKYELAAGLLEITYQTGATVILQGPCTYEVDSPSSGFLSLGKLTARVEKSEIRNPKSEVSEPPNLQISQFAVRTPAATVTDLGTAFGVEVTREGQTEAYVFQGTIRVAAVAGGDGSAAHGRVCREGEAIRVGAGDPVIRAIARGKNAAPVFVRAMPPPQAVRDAEPYAELVLSLNPVAYYRMEHPRSEKDRYVVFDSAVGGHHGELRLGDEPGPAYVPGRFGDALWLRGPGVDDRVFVPDYPKATGDRLSVTAWVMASTKPQWAMIASNWGVPARGRKNTGQFHLGLFEFRGDLSARVTQRDGQVVQVREGESEPFPVNAWQHVALVADGSILHLYRNGKEVASAPCAGVLPDPPVASLGIGCRTNPAGTDAYACSGQPLNLNRDYAWFWHGRIDELAIFNQALSAQSIERLYLGKPSQPQNAETPAKRR